MHHFAPATDQTPTATSELPTAPGAAPVATRDEAGMSTAEYCVGTVSACGFGGLLYSLLTSDFGQNLIQSIFDKVTSLLPF
jgi:hypothetical protein